MAPLLFYALVKRIRGLETSVGGDRFRFLITSLLATELWEWKSRMGLLQILKSHHSIEVK